MAPPGQQVVRQLLALATRGLRGAPPAPLAWQQPNALPWPGASSGLLLLRHPTALQHGLASAAGAAFTARSSHPPLSKALKLLLHNYKQLSKAKLSALVVLTAGAGFVAGSGETVDWGGLAWTSVGTFCAAACANTLNQLSEIPNDARMSRTALRPLPTGRVGRLHALAFAAVTGGLGVGILWQQVNPLTAVLGASNILLYAGLYTPLKRLHPVNTWVGAVVGAIPPLMGWAAAAGQLEPAAGALSATLFFWQMPHFLALAWLCKDDYARGGFRMLSLMDATGRRTAAAALRHCIYLVPMGGLAVLLEVATPAFAVEAAALAGFMGLRAVSFLRVPSQGSARTLFRASLLYLPVLMGLLVVHRVPNDHSLDIDALQQKLRAWTQPQLDALRSWIDNVPAAGPGTSGAELAVREWLQRMLGGMSGLKAQIKCPSRVYGDERDLAEDGQEEGEEGQEEEGEGDEEEAGRGEGKGT